jgi:hypothetical protein
MALQAGETDRSGIIAAGGTAQDVYTADDSAVIQCGVFFQNTSDTDMWINFGADAVVNAARLIVAGASYENPLGYIPGGRLSVLCATTGKTFVCKTA